MHFVRSARLVVLVIACVVLASCAGGAMGEYIPQSAGGLPNNAPPRPGTPEYEIFRQNLDAEAARIKSKDSPQIKTDTEKKSTPQ